MNPCIELCYLRYGKQYTPECDEFCDYAKAVKENKQLKVALEEINEHEEKNEMK